MTDLATNPPSIAIIGKGAISCLLAAYCNQAGLGYQLLVREPVPEKLYCDLLNGKSESLQDNVVLSNAKQVDLLFICTKAYQVADAISQWRNVIGENTVIALMHNGMGTEEPLLNNYPNPVLRLVTNRGALKKADQLVQETGTGDTYCGWLRSSDQNAWFESLVTAIWDNCTWYENVNEPLYRKLTVNAVINPLTSFHNVVNGALCEEKYRCEIETLVSEIYRLYQALHLPFSEEELLELVLNVAEATAENSSSMRQDVLAGRKTELDFITGHLLNRAKQLNIDMPAHLKLFNALSQL